MADFVDFKTNVSTYRYWLLPNPSTAAAIEAAAGNYMFVRQEVGRVVPLYVGIAQDLSNRIPGHNKWDAAIRLGMTHVLAHKNPNAFLRASEENDLIGYFNPPLNQQLRTGLSAFGR